MKNITATYLLLSNYLNLLGYGIFSPLYAIFVLHIGGSPFFIASTLGVYSLASGISIIIFGKLEDTRYNKKLMIVVGYMMLAIGGGLFLLAHNIFELYIIQIFNAIATGILYPAWKTAYTLAEDKGKEGLEWGLFDGGNQIIAAIAAFIGGILISIGNFTILITCMLIIQTIAAIVSVRILKS